MSLLSDKNSSSLPLSGQVQRIFLLLVVDMNRILDCLVFGFFSEGDTFSVRCVPTVRTVTTLRAPILDTNTRLHKFDLKLQIPDAFLIQVRLAAELLEVIKDVQDLTSHHLRLVTVFSTRGTGKNRTFVILRYGSRFFILIIVDRSS